MTNQLALPKPEKVTLTQVRALLIPQAESLRQQLAERGDLAGANEMRRQLEAYGKYVNDRECRDLLHAEARYTEILIGKLLGPGERGGDRRSGKFKSPAGDLNDDEKYKFRLLAEYEDVARDWISEGIVSRRRLLEKIQRLQPLLDGEELPEIRAGDFRTALDDVKSDSVSLILTDPPYAEKAIGLYADLSRLAARVLVPGGSLICYTGQATLPGVLNQLSESLTYWWTLALTHEHGPQTLPGKWVLVQWKPLVWFVKDFRLGTGYVGDRLKGSKPEKAHHEWAQGIEEVQYLIEKLTEPGELILDPFAGSGAFGRAAQEMGRRYLGVDLDPGSDCGVA